MSFSLPRNPRGLRFTGKVKALADADSPPASALGKPRPRNGAIPSPPPSIRPSALETPPRSVPPGPPPSRKDVYKADVVPTPYLAPKIITPVPKKVAHEEVSYEDDVKTMAMDRDGLDVLPGGAFKQTRPQEAAPRSPAPIPNFRPAIVQPQIVVPKKKEQRKKARGAPLALWLLASAIAAILSYRLAPEAMDAAGIVLEQRR